MFNYFKMGAAQFTGEICSCMKKKQTVIPQDFKGKKKQFLPADLTYQDSSSSEGAELRDTPMEIFLF